MLLFFIVLPPVSFRPLSGSYISQLNSHICSLNVCGLFPSPIGELHFSILDIRETERVEYTVSVPYRGATFLNIFCKYVKNTDYRVSVPYRGATFLNDMPYYIRVIGGRSFRPLSGSYISQYHLRNPMSCLGRIGGLRGKSNFIEMQPFWKVKNSHKSNI